MLTLSYANLCDSTSADPRGYVQALYTLLQSLNCSSTVKCMHPWHIAGDTPLLKGLMCRSAFVCVLEVFKTGDSDFDSFFSVSVTADVHGIASLLKQR